MLIEQQNSNGRRVRHSSAFSRQVLPRLFSKADPSGRTSVIAIKTHTYLHRPWAAFLHEAGLRQDCQAANSSDQARRSPALPRIELLISGEQTVDLQQTLGNLPLFRCRQSYAGSDQQRS
ncbi:hypothetical protein DM02DRAFT_656238 [Periconia macrospinosa]|uniref:Uncharacterized protein n=1 Tax=Periconia macrospinosa TaxID=97972 RepID=A0A2V1DP16_9PLEO|nr:hypothetical protein DM02DRAFT_656238 [Periconia macrospinosa]